MRSAGAPERARTPSPPRAPPGRWPRRAAPVPEGLIPGAGGAPRRRWRRRRLCLVQSLRNEERGTTEGAGAGSGRRGPSAAALPGLWLLPGPELPPPRASARPSLLRTRPTCALAPSVSTIRLPEARGKPAGPRASSRPCENPPARAPGRCPEAWSSPGEPWPRPRSETGELG